MGLDMYLYTNSPELASEVHETEPYGEYITDWYRKSGVVLYWRKTNCIHKWFVDHVQDVRDDCGTYDVEVEQLEELLATCEEVLHDRSKAYDLLPPQSGFFFGSDEFDEWYWQDLEFTVRELSRILGMLVDEPEPRFYSHKVHPARPDWYVTFRYSSSW